MSDRSKAPPVAPMDLKNMRQNGVHSLLVCCLKCGAQRVLSVDDQPENLTVKSFGPRMVCSSCGAKGADVRPNWSDV
jgi:hypothetical protein